MSDDPFKSTPQISFDEKVELVWRLAAKHGIQRRKSPTISRQTRNRSMLLTSAQERLWLLEQLEPGNPTYHIVRAELLTGNLDLSALTSTISEIVRRHEILRTTFVWGDGHPIQIIKDGDHSLETAPAVEPAGGQQKIVERIDLRGYPAELRLSEARRIAERKAKERFEFEKGPMLRVVLIHLDAAEYLMIIIVHQIVFDWRSHSVFSRELTELYDASCGDRRPQLPALEVQFADFAAWQREELQGVAFTSAVAYWKDQLKNAPPILELPYDHLPPPIQRFDGARQPIELSGKLTGQLTEFSRRLSVTSFIVLLTAFKILLQRYTGRGDIVVACPVTTRETPETENLIGFFVNTLPLRTDMSDNPTSSHLLKRVQIRILKALAHQGMPFETLIDELRLPRVLNRDPVFQVMFIFQDTPLPPLAHVCMVRR